LKPGQRCPKCGKGKIYRIKEPAVVVRITEQAPLQPTVYEKERWRCNLCGDVFTAEAPEGVGQPSGTKLRRAWGVAEVWNRDAFP
jgi:rubredoxin